jgi:hypothetical protein
MLKTDTWTLSQKNILKVYLAASKLETSQGRVWYSVARGICKDLADIYNVPLKTVACVMSVLSPATTWEKNVEYTDALLCDWVNDSVDLDGTMYSTYLANATKALTMLNNNNVADGWYDAEFTELNSGFKTWSFAHNIYDETETHICTIDRHAYRVWKFGLDNLGTIKVPSFTRKQYNNIVLDYIFVANQVGITVESLQAITWLVIRNKLFPVTDK